MKKILNCLLVIALVIGLLSTPRQRRKSCWVRGQPFPIRSIQKCLTPTIKSQGVQINYQAIGSGGGIRQLINKTVDFGGTDAFMSDEKLKELPPIVHIPTCLGAVSVTYNLPARLHSNLLPDVLADIFLGKITKWNDPRLQKINSGVKLPDMNIVVVHRSDGSGTTFIFTDYLAKISSDWTKKWGEENRLTGRRDWEQRETPGSRTGKTAARKYRLC